VQEPTQEKKQKVKNASERKLTKSQRAAEKAQKEAQARRLEKIKKAETKLADLDDLVKVPSRKSKSQAKTPLPQDDDDSDFGDEGALTAREAEEKAKKKRSLRFYTSQIAQKSNKRDAAGRNAGGDEDLPYRERLRERQARLNAEAERRGRAQANQAEQLGGDSDDDDRRLAREIRGDAEEADEDEYYDMVASRNKQKKADKKTRAELAEAAQGGRVEEIEEVGPDGKRRITYQIEKNKGLAPKRNKDVRNPRVKKRKKFEQKKKKLASIRQVYKGGEERGGYGGELTGIKKNLVKSVKL
jgi:U3 small nucleolar RNA-associated protein 3